MDSKLADEHSKKLHRNFVEPNSEDLLIHELRLARQLKTVLQKCRGKTCPGCGYSINEEKFAKELVNSITKYNARATTVTVKNAAELVYDIKKMNFLSIIGNIVDMRQAISALGKSFGCDNIEKYNGMATLETYHITDGGNKIWHEKCHESDPNEDYSPSCEHDHITKDEL